MNYTVQDTATALRATAAFSLLLYFPGYLLGFAFNLQGFRRLSFAHRSAWAIALSFCCTPLLFGSFITAGAASAVLLWAVAAACLLPLLRASRPRRADAGVLALLAAGALLILLELSDIEHAGHLYLGVSTLDQQYRVAFTQALFRNPSHPVNPFFHPGHAVALRYYYFWYALCALCMRLGHVGARPALIASSLWCLAGLGAVAALFLRHFLAVRRPLRRQVALCLGLLAVTGADLLPVLVNLATGEPYLGDTEWWSSGQVSSWLDSLLWVPHHTAALLCCMMSFLLLWLGREAGNWRAKAGLCVLAAVAAASAFGLSIYLAAGFAVLMLCWAVRLATQRQRRGAIPLVAASAGLAVLLLLPFMRGLLRTGSGTQGGSSASAGHLLQLDVRRMIDSTLISGLPVFAGFNQRHPGVLDQAVRLALLVPGYGIELGFWGLVLIVAWRRRRTLDEARRTALFLSLCALVLISFVRSAVIENNDFGYRVALIPSFLLLLLGSDLLFPLARQPSAKLKWAAGTLLALGVAGTAFQAASLRLYLPWAERADPALHGLSATLLERRRTFDVLSTRLPADAIVQAHQTDSQNYFQVANMLFSDHAMATDAAADCGAVFGGDPSSCRQLRRELQSLYESAAPATGARTICQRWGIDTLIAESTDPAFRASDSWAWQLPRIAQSGHMVAVRCADPAGRPTMPPR